MGGFNFDAAMAVADKAIINTLAEQLTFPDISPDPVSAAIDPQTGENEHGETWRYYSALVAAEHIPGIRKGMPVQYNGKAYTVADLQRAGQSWELVIT
ncbi:MAG: hypothetical protein OIF57_10505 [Marinobacterium sp.]|nr:hypothetical protein [Marinobacterium sp.]